MGAVVKNQIMICKADNQSLSSEFGAVIRRWIDLAKPDGSDDLALLEWWDDQIARELTDIAFRYFREIAVTPEMIEAGERALLRFRGSFDDEELAKAIYIAMEECRDT